MEIKSESAKSEGWKFYIEKEGSEIARAYLYIMHNSLHKEPFGLLEDVFVQEEYRGNIYGIKVIRKAIDEAKAKKCYKLIATSRFEREYVHEIYERMKFKRHGLEFRMDFPENLSA